MSRFSRMRDRALNARPGLAGPQNALALWPTCRAPPGGAGPAGACEIRDPTDPPRLLHMSPRQPRVAAVLPDQAPGEGDVLERDDPETLFSPDQLLVTAFGDFLAETLEGLAVSSSSFYKWRN